MALVVTGSCSPACGRTVGITPSFRGWTGRRPFQGVAATRRDHGWHGPTRAGTGRHGPRCSRVCAAGVAHSVVDAPSTTRVGPVVVIDNYDSFTYNLCQYLGDLGCDYTVLANDARTVEEIAATRPAGVLISPGPGRPEDSGISLAAVRELGAAGVPIFGVCMGLQCIGQVYGARIVRAPGGVMHGKTSPVLHRGDDPLLRGLPSPFLAARYHSLVIDRESCPPDLDITAWCDDGTIMAARSKAHPAVAGVQFHPESIITDNGKLIVQNWVQSLQG